VSPKIKLNFTPFLRRIYVVSCNPARIYCGCFAVPLWVGRWLLFQQNNGEQYSDTTDSRPIHHRQSIATYRPTDTLDRYVDLQSADMSTDSGLCYTCSVFFSSVGRIAFIMYTLSFRGEFSTHRSRNRLLIYSLLQSSSPTKYHIHLFGSNI